jgi:hypothetical protein
MSGHNQNLLLGFDWVCEVLEKKSYQVHAGCALSGFATVQEAIV